MKTKEVKIEVSARHVHLSQADVERLFGEGYQLKTKKEIMGGFVAEERVTLVGPKREMERVAILGPVRNETQVELALTDARTLGIADCPVKLSGDLAGTPGITIKTDLASIDLDHGVIAAKRHIHILDEEAAELGIKTGDTVKLDCKNEIGRGLVFDDVIVRTGDLGTCVHLDTDEGNACGIGKADTCKIIVD